MLKSLIFVSNFFIKMSIFGRKVFDQKKSSDIQRRHNKSSSPFAFIYLSAVIIVQTVKLHTNLMV